MPKKLRAKSRRQRQAVAPLTQVRRTARSHHSKQAKRKAKTSQGRRRSPCHQNIVHEIPSQLQEADFLPQSLRTYKNSEELRSRIRSGIITPIHEQWEKARLSNPPREFPPATAREVDPLRISSHHPHSSRQPTWRDPLSPFAVGGDDLDPFGCQRGGMIVDPLRSGFPRALIDPSSGLPNRLPPGAVPPGARFDPFGPIGTSPSGPNPDHLPPPGYDDMYL